MCDFLKIQVLLIVFEFSSTTSDIQTRTIFQYDVTVLFVLILSNTKWAKKTNNFVKIQGKIGSEINLNTTHSRYAKTYSSMLIVRLKGLG